MFRKSVAGAAAGPGEDAGEDGEGGGGPRTPARGGTRGTPREVIKFYPGKKRFRNLN
jgi:hypothetical protein